MKFKENDAVKLLVDLPSENIVKNGDIGTIVSVFSVPEEAYEVEFLNKEGKTIAQIALLPKQIVLIK